MAPFLMALFLWIWRVEDALGVLHLVIRSFKGCMAQLLQNRRKSDFDSDAELEREYLMKIQQEKRTVRLQIVLQEDFSCFTELREYLPKTAKEKLAARYFCRAMTCESQIIYLKQAVAFLVGTAWTNIDPKIATSHIPEDAAQQQSHCGNSVQRNENLITNLTSRRDLQATSSLWSKKRNIDLDRPQSSAPVPVVCPALLEAHGPSRSDKVRTDSADEVRGKGVAFEEETAAIPVSSGIGARSFLRRKATWSQSTARVLGSMFGNHAQASVWSSSSDGSEDEIEAGACESTDLASRSQSAGVVALVSSPEMSGKVFGAGKRTLTELASEIPSTQLVSGRHMAEKKGFKALPCSSCSTPEESSDILSSAPALTDLSKPAANTQEGWSNAAALLQARCRRLLLDRAVDWNTDDSNASSVDDVATAIDILIHLKTAKAANRALERLTESNIKSSFELHRIYAAGVFLYSCTQHDFTAAPVSSLLLHPLPVTASAAFLQARCRRVLLDRAAHISESESTSDMSDPTESCILDNDEESQHDSVGDEVALFCAEETSAEVGSRPMLTSHLVMSSSKFHSKTDLEMRLFGRDENHGGRYQELKLS